MKEESRGSPLFHFVASITVANFDAAHASVAGVYGLRHAVCMRRDNYSAFLQVCRYRDKLET